jgi:predicted nucleic acid-binding protein
VADVLVDSNVLLDVLTEDPEWLDWSSQALARAADGGRLVVNPLVYAEISIGFDRVEDLDTVLDPGTFERRPLPWEAAFLAGKIFLRYKAAGGARRSPLPDFYIGAHAAIERLTLLTRDPRRYRSYFSRLRLIAP